MAKVLNYDEYIQHIQEGGELMNMYSVTLIQGEERKGMPYFAHHHMAHAHVTNRAEAEHEGWTVQFVLGQGIAVPKSTLQAE